MVLGWCWLVGYSGSLLGTLVALALIYRGSVRGGR